MAEKMVRMQVYLPREIYNRLTQRADKHAITLAHQIRAAIEEYLERIEAEMDSVLLADDPIFQMIGRHSSTVTDASVNHDYYLYGMPKREPATPSAKAVGEKRASYRTRARKPTRKRKAK